MLTVAMHDIAHLYMVMIYSLRGGSAKVVEGLLQSGVVTPPPEDVEDRAPRAAG
jgi:hypothetical protein